MTGVESVRLPDPTAGNTRIHFLWLVSAAAFLFAGVVWSGSQAYAVELSPAEAQSHEDERAEADRVELLGRLQLAGIASRRAGPPRLPATKLAAAPTPDEQELALARYMSAVGTDSVENAVAQSGSLLAQRVLDDERINLASGYGDVAAGRVDPRVLALLLYLAEAHGEVTVSCLISGHSRFVAQTSSEIRRKAPRRVSAHTYGRAVDISSIGGVPVIGNQQPGGIVDRAVQDILSLPSSLQPSQVISLLDLSGPSFRLPDHGDHLHVGY
jgi:uncharacterized protein YcbK (DUF882 family)